MINLNFSSFLLFHSDNSPLPRNTNVLYIKNINPKRSIYVLYFAENELCHLKVGKNSNIAFMQISDVKSAFKGLGFACKMQKQKKRIYSLLNSDTALLISDKQKNKIEVIK